MSRGIDDFTVQQVMNFLGEKIAAIDEEFPSQHKTLGYAYMNNVGSSQPNNVGWHVSKIQEAAAKRHKLQELLWDIERQCGELYDSKQKEVAR